MRTLVIYNLVLRIDGYGDNPLEEAKEVLVKVNSYIAKMGGDPGIWFDESRECQAEYVEECWDEV